MVLRSRQRLWHRVAFSWVTILILLLLTVMLVRSNLDIYGKNARASERALSAQIELSKMQKRADVLNRNLEYIKTTQGVEEELRRKFDVSKEGEHLLVIVDKEVELEAPVVKESWLGNLWRKLTQ